MKRAPAHAGSLRISERLAFVVMFTAMAGFVVGLTFVAARSGASAGPGRTVAASSRTELAGLGDQQSRQPCGGTKAAFTVATRTRAARPSEALNTRLAVALRATAGASASQLSVGVIDTATGAEALYHASKHYPAAGIAGANILAALLYEHQQAGTAITRQDAALAAKMIRNGSRTAAARLWPAISRGGGLAAANRALRLRHTVPGPAGARALTRTTVADQLQLLVDLATARSALQPACRSYELNLMASTADGQRWGVPAAASPGTRYAVSDGWQPDPRRLVVNSVGVIDHGRDELLVVVLSRDWPARAAGISAVQAAAIAAASAIFQSS